jgi:spermidine synthase
VQRYIIPLIFVLSGFAGLIFEVVWARQLVLVFGNTTQAISAILTGFFGGMALGSWLGGRLADRVRNPLRFYGQLELLLAVIVIATPYSFQLIHELYRVSFDAFVNARATMVFVRYSLALLALAPATILMGATLPSLTRHLARGKTNLNAAFSKLYVANTIGASFGAAAAGLVLIELFGLSGALLVGAACSATAGVIALVMSQQPQSDMAPPDAAIHAQPSANIGAQTLSLSRVALVISFVSGLTSLSYQILWTRLISSGTGGSTYVFTVILTVFLIGLAMGAVEYKRRRARLVNVVGAVAFAQIATAVLAVAGMYALNALDPFNGAFLWKALAVVFPATFVMGFCFPATSALIDAPDGTVGSRSGLLLATNTAGAIAGTILVPFALVPLLGSAVVLGLIAVVNAITGVTLSVVGNRGARNTSLIALGSATVASIAVFIALGNLFVDPGVARLHRVRGTLFRSGEDEIASVQAGSLRGQQHLWVNGFSMTALTVDAKLMPILPLALRPRSQTLLAIAFGMGSTYRSSVLAGLRTDVVELVPTVPRMFDAFYMDAGAIASNPLGRIIVADGRNYVELVDRHYDIIVVDPPPPLQSSGVSIISSREFYIAAQRRLVPGGVMMQWVPWSQDAADVKDHVRTFRSVFPNVIVSVGPGGNGFYMFGSDRDMSFEESNVRQVISRPNVLTDISSAHDSPANDIASWQILIMNLERLRGPEVAEFAGKGPLITDNRPLPEYFLLRAALGAPSPAFKESDMRPRSFSRQ